MKRLVLVSGLLLLVLFVSTNGFCDEFVLDNLDNDSALSDQAGSADALWSIITSVETSPVFGLSIDSTTVQSSPSSLKIDWAKSSGLEWAHFRFACFDKTDNVNDWTGYTGIRVDVYGESPNTLLKLMDTDGEESGDLGFITHTGTTFDTLELAFANLNNCDLDKISEILCFVNAGSATGSGTCYYDNLRLYSATSELVLDNFDNDSSTEDDPSNADCKVSVNRQLLTSAISFSIDTSTVYSSPASVKCDLNNKQPWGTFFIGNLQNETANYGDFSDAATLKVAVWTDIAGQILIKLKDNAGTESGDLGFITPLTNQWDVLEWTIDGNANLGSVDLSNIQELIVFPA